jgi:hypothetical protein
MWKARVAIVSALLLAMGIGAICVTPAHAAFNAIMSCAQSTACLEWDNTKTGDAVKGVSSKGDAIHGQTKFNSTGKTAGRAGVFGEDLSTSGTLNAGVSGVSTNGAGVIGTSSTFNAVEGLSKNSTGVYGQTGAPGGFGSAGRNTTASGGGGAGVFGDGGPVSVGVIGTASSGNGVYAYSGTGTSLHVNQGPTTSTDELWLQGNNATPHFLFDATDQNSNTLFYVQSSGFTAAQGVFIINGNAAMGAPFNIAGATHSDLDIARFFDGNEVLTSHITDEGNIHITGQLFSAGPCQSGCSVGGKPVRAVNTYGSVAAQPMIEDTGEAELVEGSASVALDPKFANVIDPTSTYVVLLTPEGDCRGLYVGNRTATGFTVRELQGGRTNVGFAYRIVAKRFGLDAQRLPMTTLQHADARLRQVPRHQ